MKAIVKGELGEVSYVTDRPLPKLRPGYILIKTSAVALNPIDWMKVDSFPAPGTLLGHDYSGIVEQVGPEVQRPLKKGDRVFGYTIGGDRLNPENGAFAEYILGKAEFVYRIPQGMGFEEAAALPAGVQSANMALWLKLGLREERERVEVGSKGQFVMVYGGSTATASMAIQMAVRSGYTVISTASPRNIESVKALGATHVLDYNRPDCAAAINELTGNQLRLVLDTVAVPQSAKICAEAMSSEGGRYVELLPVPFPRKDVEVIFMDATTTMGEYYEYGPDRMPIPVDEEAFKFGKEHVEIAERLLQQGEIHAHQLDFGSGGLKGVLDGLKRLREGRVSGKKLVYLVE
ncbi:hypothetical protein M409DRAFT_63945 [Zasmidium cellare ATCC 36951]|uniref:Enoyl reductase (ER) domain-containing protein n=1 Tax=Zasmidium cellare ATCC 36951 TaxID=1080233 RepID=A0A6A6CUT4_ZASCE|nr:uncharacterized protein M409DRAFT_63945 [Zasmidium cellare ATCC 36951]KAF2170924.1 hypothetical protein M409DRAFT_63945 [Zasmidium cellare ATCC 36951]